MRGRRGVGWRGVCSYGWEGGVCGWSQGRGVTTSTPVS